MMLLESLYDSRLCNFLLVPEADEDVVWKDDKRHPTSQLKAMGTPLEGKGRELGAYAIKRVAAGAHLSTPWVFLSP